MAEKGIDDAINAGATIVQIPVASAEEVLRLFGAPPGPPPSGGGDPQNPPAGEPPAGAAANPARIRVYASGDCHAAAGRVAAVLWGCPDLYQMGGDLYVRAVEDGHPAITLAKRGTVSACVTAVAQFFTGGGEFEVDVHPPTSVIDLLMARKEWPRVPVIERVANGPTLTADGRILTAPGYDAASRTFGAFSPLPAGFVVPAAPTRRDAGAAAYRLLDLVGDFVFVAPTDLSAWFAAALTMVCRTALDRVPIFLITANRAGTGKSHLIEIFTTIANGASAGATDYTDNLDKLEKLVTALVAEGKTVANFDNLPNGTAFGNAVIDRLVTAINWTGRMLGESRTVTAPNTMTVLASGNLLTTNEDTTRRVVSCRLHTDLANPEDRTDLADPDLMEHVEDLRVPLLLDLLTVVAAYVAAGSPPPPASSALGSFRQWNRRVLGIIHWLRLPCPLQATREQRKGLNATAARNVALLEAIDGYLKTQRNKPAHFTASDLAKEVSKTTDRQYSESAHADALAEAFTALGISRREPLDIGRYLRGINGNWFSDENRRIRVIDDGKTGGRTRWKLEVETLSKGAAEGGDTGGGGGGPRGDRCDRCDGEATPQERQTIREFIRSWAQEQGFPHTREGFEIISPISPISPHPPETPGNTGDSATANPGEMPNRSHLSSTDLTSADPAGPPPADPRGDIPRAGTDLTCDLTSPAIDPADGEWGPDNADGEPKSDRVVAVPDDLRQIEPGVWEV